VVQSTVSSRAHAGRFQEGTLLQGKYRLLRCVDEGAIGEIWEAHHEDLDCEVAVKVLRDETSSLDASLRLAAEARALGRLAHPAVLRVLDLGRTDGGDPYLVTELLQGECLDVVMAREARFDARAAVQLLLPIVDGLGLAHERGVVHRDVKTANIFLARTAGTRLQPKVIDFGIAQLREPLDPHLTAAGTVIGSPDTMSPEQARGEAYIDARTDVWSLCAVLYEMVTGALPFSGGDPYEVMHAIVHDEPVPIAGEPGLWAIVEQGLRKDPADRWPSMRELGTRLAEWLVDQGYTEDATGTSLHGSWPAATGARCISSYPPVAMVPPPVRAAASWKMPLLAAAVAVVGLVVVLMPAATRGEATAAQPSPALAVPAPPRPVSAPVPSASVAPRPAPRPVRVWTASPAPKSEPPRPSRSDLKNPY
jgi:eukaryotic-like serine/threonine-protein kinase